MIGSFYNCTLIGNYCTSGAATDSIISSDSKAVNCLFYQNRAHNTTYLDIAVRFANNDLVTPFTPYLTNCLWSAQGTYSAAHTEASMARTLDSQLMNAGKFAFAGTGETPYALVGGAAARAAGRLDDNIRAMVGETDLAGNPRIIGNRISLGCYQRKYPGFTVIFR